jgi:epoxyqueuosine reductase
MSIIWEMDAATLIAWALEAGFDRAGLAPLDPFESEREGRAFTAWLERGDHAGMGWMAERAAERLEPARVLPGARWALCVALQYWPLPDDDPPPGDLWPRVARYARGRDYHNLMGKRLKKLARRIRRETGCDTRTYVDTGPVLERALAERAGLGVAGKNTCLLTREGSYFFLGEVFLDLEVEMETIEAGAPAGPQAPLTDLCGRCTRCLDACPTGALPEPYRLDASRCISYWTIEHRGPADDVPEEIRDAVGEWVFGCDVCQVVCPWNLRPQEPTGETDFRIPERRRDLDLLGLLALSEEEYKERFEGSAMQRARLDGLKRNAARVLEGGEGAG